MRAKSEDDSPDVIVYGTIALDRFFFPGRYKTAVERCGGEAFNTASLLDAWGLTVLLTGTALGKDAESDRLRELLDAANVGTLRRYIPDISDAITPVCEIRVDSDGERHFRGRGFDRAIAPPPLPEAVFRKRPLFVTDGNLGKAAVIETLRAVSFGCPIVAMDFFTLPEIVRVSRLQISSRDWMYKHVVPTTISPMEMAQKWVTDGAQTAIVTMGADGGIVCDREIGIFTYPAVSIDNIVDTTGAGDAFRAGLSYALLQNWQITSIVAFASAAAALHCTLYGGASRISLASVLALQGTFVL